MVRLEILDQDEKTISTHTLGEGLTLLGRSPGAHVHLSGSQIGPLHVGIQVRGEKPVVMDLGGPTRLKVDGKQTLEKVLTEKSAILEIGSRRVRLSQIEPALVPLDAAKWAPLKSDSKSARPSLRVRLFYKGVPREVIETRESFLLGAEAGLPSPFRLAWMEGAAAQAVLPQEWLALGGRIQAGDQILKLDDWRAPVRLEAERIYRVFAGPYRLDLLVTTEGLKIAPLRRDFFPKELRKPFAGSALGILGMFLLWIALFGKTQTKVEEPYPVYARIQNIPVEKIFEPEPRSNEPQAGGGSGSESKNTTAPQVGGAAAPPSKLASQLTSGLKNLVGNVLSQAKNTNAIVAESGVGAAAPAAVGLGSPNSASKLAAVGAGAAQVAGATKLGKLAIAGSGQGFNGGSGTGLGQGFGSGIGTGQGKGIGAAGFRLVEEESIVDGGLDKSVIEAVIRNNLSQIKYCYERQLVAEPDLFGKVVALWNINSNGQVENAAVKQSTLNSPPVEQCMMSKISGWKFPQPKNGTRVTVSYPFLFKSTK